MFTALLQNLQVYAISRFNAILEQLSSVENPFAKRVYFVSEVTISAGVRNTLPRDRSNAPRFAGVLQWRSTSFRHHTLSDRTGNTDLNRDFAVSSTPLRDSASVRFVTVPRPILRFQSENFDSLRQLR